MDKVIKYLNEKKEKLMIMQQEREKNIDNIKHIEEENKHLDNDFDSILQSLNDLQQSIDNFQKLNEEKEHTKDKLVSAIIFSISFSLICTVTTFRELNLIAILISIPLTSIVTGVIALIPYLELKKDFKNINLENLKLMFEKEEQEKEINREKYESNNLEIKTLLTKNRVLDAIIDKTTTQLLQDEKTHNEIGESFIERKPTYDKFKPVVENILEEEKIKEKVKTYSNN